MAQTQRFLSYLPSSVHEAPPLAPADDPIERREEELFTIVPRKRTTTFDVRRAIRLMADKGSFFEVGPLWGTDQVTGLIRMGGYPMGVIASDSRHINGGALTADGCDKLRRHIDVCDLFHLPLVNLVDNAFKHTPTGTPIELTGGVDDNAVVFKVSDRGAGMPSPESDDAFLPYYRLPGRVADGESTGLGLWIARRLAEAQSGSLTYSARDGGGVTFELRLPAVTPSQ